MSLPSVPEGPLAYIYEEMRAQTLYDYFQEAVNKLLEAQPDFIQHARWFDKEVDSLHLVSRPQDTRSVGQIGYHVIYRTVDLVERVRSWGIVIANPRIIMHGSIPYPRAKTRRHYLADDSLMPGTRGIVRRHDKYEQLALSSSALQGPIKAKLTDARWELPLLRTFKEDVLTIASSYPVLTDSNRTPHLADLNATPRY